MSTNATHMTKLRRCLVTFGVIVGIVGILHARGILAISVSTTLIVCSLTLMKNKGVIFASLLFALLSVGIFMFGAGRGTPVAVSLPVVIAGVLSTVRTEARERSELERRKILSAFNSFCWLHIASWIFFFPGLFIFSFYPEIATPVFLVAFVSMPIGTLGALMFGYQYDKSIVVAR